MGSKWQIKIKSLGYKASNLSGNSNRQFPKRSLAYILACISKISYINNITNMDILGITFLSNLWLTACITFFPFCIIIFMKRLVN